MLRIRSEQVRALSLDEAYRGFVLAMIEHLRTHFSPELGELDELALGEEVLVCLDRARGYGISSRRDCARFLGLAAALGWSFDTERAWVPAMLKNPASGPSDRLAAVYERCVHELQQAADTVLLRQRFGL